MSGAPRFTQGSTLRHVVVMSLTGSVGLTFMFLVDVVTLFWVAQMRDPAAVAGVGIAWTIQFFTISLALGLAIAATALVSRALGARRREEARSIAAAGLMISAALAGLAGLTVAVFAGDFVALIGAEGAVAEVARRFLVVSAPSLPLIALGMLGASILRAEGDAVRAMSVTVSAGFVALVLDPLLIFGLGLGVDGAAIVVVLSRLTTAGLALFYAVRIHDLVARIAFRHVRVWWRRFAAIAGPAVLTQLSTSVGNLIATGIVAGFGDEALAGWAVVTRLTVFAFGGILALSAAIGGIIGQNHGAGLADRVRAAYRDALLYCAGYTLLAWAVLAAATGPVITLFHVPEAGQDVVRAFTFVAAGGFVFNGAMFVANAAWNVLGRPLRSTAFNWVRDGLLLWPLATAGAAMAGAPGAVYGQALAGAVTGLAAALAGWRFVTLGARAAAIRAAPMPAE